MFQVLILCAFTAFITVYFTLVCAKKKPKKQAKPSPKDQKSVMEKSKMFSAGYFSSHIFPLVLLYSIGSIAHLLRNLLAMSES
ncbi:hypothetical protein L596_024767 [Steinernema carpocapsae]|uniref:Uncharacterized protein n=1 Tax=Steinernema carpocapsae TaxID=34508 RepID=A0A4U5M5P7_STECR|nr:hypothetical protein L596_024767 [Steinernema carpocapsae]